MEERDVPEVFSKQYFRQVGKHPKSQARNSLLYYSAFLLGCDAKPDWVMQSPEARLL